MSPKNHGISSNWWKLEIQKNPAKKKSQTCQTGGSQLILRVMFFGRVKKHHLLRHAGTTLLALPPPMLLGLWFQVADCWDFEVRGKHVGKKSPFFTPFGEYVYLFSKHLKPIYKYLEDIITIKDFLFSPLFGEDSHFDYIIFFKGVETTNLIRNKYHFC